uniref:Tyrosinase A3 n=1 Tax=Pinctada maxima TaxID=104660 RepID=A0A024CI03_PINMA|nr:tyrosinase A3 [Pinctada maxima]
MKGLLWRFFLLVGLICVVYPDIIEIRVARELEECFEQRRFDTNQTDPRYDNIHGYCIQNFRWHLQEHYWKNITMETSNWIEELLRISNRKVRKKRQSLPVRKEYRRLTDQERADYHRAINMLKRDTTVKPNRYDALGLLHQRRGDDVHHGAGFLGFHRVLLVVYENALRQKVPTVTLPYWDSRLDQPLRDPTRSIIWSPQFLGTMRGRVINGPFAFWQTPAGPLVRNGGQEGELFTYNHIRAVMTRSHLEEISEPHAPPPFDFEIRHGDVHQMVGGIMAPAETAGYDPVFFLHHCFVDYLWEVFRRSQKEKGVDPTKDYPRRYGPAAHAPKEQMGLGRLLNEHGLSDMFTSRLYTYEPSPTCSYRRPTCGSNYLTCEFGFGRPQCVTLEMLSTTPTQSSRSNIPLQWRQFVPQLQTGVPRSPVPNQFRSALARAQARQQGNTLPNRAPNPNQFGTPRRFGRTKRQADAHAIDGGRLTQMGQNILSQFGGNQLSEFIRNKTKPLPEKAIPKLYKQRHHKRIFSK